MQITGFILIGMFLLSSMIHLIFCFQENDKYRAITKPLPLAFLGTAIAFLIPNHPLAYIGAYCCLIGDIILLFKKKYSFNFGVIFFLAAHILFFIQIVSFLSYQIPFYAYIILVTAIILILIILYKPLSKLFGKTACLGIPYLTFLVVMFAMGVALACNAPNCWPGVLVSIGYVLFFVSDNLLALTKFVKDIKRRNFYIMITYLPSVFCILLGFVLMVI